MMATGAFGMEAGVGPQAGSAGFYVWPRSRSADAMEGFLRRIGDAIRGRALKARAEDDSRVIRRCQDGDLAAFEELVRRYHDTAVRLAMGFLRDPEEAADASQDAFVRALEALPRFDPEQPFFPWFYAILRNACFNRLRRLRRRELPLEAAGDPVAPEAREPGPALGPALERLSPEHREVLALRHWQGMSYEDIARAQAVPLGTVMSRLHHARRKLREALEAGDFGRMP